MEDVIRIFEKIIEQKETKRLDELEETIAAYHAEILSLDVKFTKRCKAIEEIIDNKAGASEVDKFNGTLDEHEEKIDKIAEKKGWRQQGWQYGTVRSEFAYYVPRTFNRTVPPHRSSVQFLKRTVPVPFQKRRDVPAYRTS